MRQLAESDLHIITGVGTRERRYAVIMTQESAAETLGAHGAGGASLTTITTAIGLHERGIPLELITPSPRDATAELSIPTRFYDLNTLARQALGEIEDPDTLSSDDLLAIYSKPEVAEAIAGGIEPGDILHAHFYTTKGLLEHMPRDARVIYYHHSPFTEVRRLYDPRMRGARRDSSKTSPKRAGAEEWLLRNADALVVFTEAEARLTQEMYPDIDLEGRIHAIPLGVDTRRFNPERKDELKTAMRNKYGIPQHAKVLYMQARIGGSQGQVELAQMFQDNFMAKDPDLYLVLAGGAARGEQEYLERVQTLQRQSSGRIILTGPVPPEAGHALGDVSFGFKLETFGFSNLEAMGMGNLLVVQDNPIHREVYGDNGGVHYVDLTRLTDPEEADKIYDFIQAQISDNATRMSNVERAHAYTWDATVDKLKELTDNMAEA